MLADISNKSSERVDTDNARTVYKLSSLKMHVSLRILVFAGSTTLNVITSDF